MLLTEVGLQNVSECVILAEEIINLIKNDTSHKVLAQGMNAILKLGMLVPENVVPYHEKLVDVAKNYLKVVELL